MKILIIIIFGLFPSLVIGQKIVYYDFSVSTAYLPSYGSQTERYFKINNKVNRTSIEDNWRDGKIKERKNMPIDVNFENVIYLLDSLNRLQEFTFKINTYLIDTLKSRDFWKNTFQITDQDIDNFFVNRETVTLNITDIQKERGEGVVIDGAPYCFDLIIKRTGQDTLKHSFTGNFLDEVQTSNISNWLPMYLAYREHKFFDSVNLVEEYFNDKKLESILFRFIAWKKNEE